MNNDLHHARQVLEVEAQAILQARDKLTPEFATAVGYLSDAVKNGRKVVVTGVGKSGKVAAKIAATMSSLGAPALYLHPTEGAHGDLGVFSTGDVMLALSYSGTTEEILQLIPRVRALQGKIITILGNLKSPLAEQSDVVLDGSVAQEAGPLNLAPTASTTVALALGDALSVALSVRFDFKEEDFAENHPGGRLGRRLTLKVSDLMKSGGELPWLEASASMDAVVSLSTEKKLGAVLVKAAGGKLLGIITDGDIRRALLHKEKFFQMTAEEVMTKSPIHVQPGERALKALELMENRASQIGVLPVVEASGKCVGLIRLHDLIGRL